MTPITHIDSQQMAQIMQDARIARAEFIRDGIVSITSRIASLFSAKSAKTA
ncbi:MAG: hypothetical protein Q7J57_02575 [Gemmobacter sp.]|nr:hypothetical protein [Gemmobacter sp.]